MGNISQLQESITTSEIAVEWLVGIVETDHNCVYFRSNLSRYKNESGGSIHIGRIEYPSCFLRDGPTTVSYWDCVS